MQGRGAAFRIRLQGGASSSRGQLELRISGPWGWTGAESDLLQGSRGCVLQGVGPLEFPLAGPRTVHHVHVSKIG